MIDWQPPESFNPETPGLGLPPLEGVTHTPRTFDTVKNSSGTGICIRLETV